MSGAMKRGLALVIPCALLGLGAAAAGGGMDLSGRAGLPTALGQGLRALSLSGFWGNLAAWLIVVLVCLLPLALPIWRRRRTGRFHAVDLLAVLAVPVLFAGLYFAVNPTLLDWAAAPMFPFAAGICALSLVAAWLVLRLLDYMDRCAQEQLAAGLRPLLTVCAALTAFSAVFSATCLYLERSRAVTGGNTAEPQAALFTNGVLLFLAVLEATPYLLGAITLLWGAGLAAAMEERLFGERAVELCRRTAVGCRIVVQATVLLAVFANLLQLALMEQMRSTFFTASLPLFPLLLAGALFLLCRLLQRGKQLQDDSDSII